MTSPLTDHNQKTILLATINASFIHASLGLRYLYAQLGAMQESCRILEFTTRVRAVDIVEKLLECNPGIIGFGVYIWNIEHTTQVVSLIKAIRPDVRIVIGGPEVSYEFHELPLFASCDHIITGAADLAFADLCSRLLQHEPVDKVLHANIRELDAIRLPYAYYTDEDLQNRIIYVEASRGCPFRCEFCLSALDKTSIPFDLGRFLKEIDLLYKRGARTFKFVDRTFNLKVETSVRILEFFLERMDDRLFVHFEIIPDRLPDAIKQLVKRFPAGSLQFEVGVQSFNPMVQSLISRRQDNDKTIENLHWLKKNTRAHIHADLIFGLPGEDLNSFAAGFDRLYAMNPDDIQLGILKRLKGTPLVRHSNTYQLKFENFPPYSILNTDRIDFQTMQRVKRFARYWELIVNSGQFRKTVLILLGSDPFNRFLLYSDWLYAYTGQTHKIALRRLYDLLFTGLTDSSQGCYSESGMEVCTALLADYKNAGLKGAPEFYKQLAQPN